MANQWWNGRSLAIGILLLASASSLAGTETTEPPSGLWRWFNPATAPFIPVPEIDVDPYSGTTLGLIPVFLIKDEHREIREIIAPDVIHNPNFGFGARGRIFAYPSDDTQWSVVFGAKQRIESELDAEYSSGRSRQGRWSFNARAVYDRSGTPRFFGFGNRSRQIDQTNYTNEQKFIEAALGWNWSRTWQLTYTARVRTVDILSGRLAGVESIERRFPKVSGRGENREILNRLSITYDTRDDLTVPTRGTQWVVYGGVADAQGILNSTLYDVAGLDVRHLWRVRKDAVLAGHIALRYMPKADNVPFWALSSIGGDRSVVGAEQPLRGFGAARFVDRHAFSSSLEYRRQVLSADAFSTRVILELAPFVEVGRVFSKAGADPLSHLHYVFGLGIRAIASPFVVGYIDIGHGSEGTAVFTGINYPF
jgi:outer membrane protein assembly factor BamA